MSDELVPAAAEASFGAVLKLKIGADFEEVTGVTNIDGLESMNKIETVTPHSTDSRAQRKIATTKEVGDVTVELNDIPSDATQQALWDLADTGDFARFQVVASDVNETTAHFQGIVASIKRSHGVEGKRPLNVTIAVDGDVEYTDNTEA